MRVLTSLDTPPAPSVFVPTMGALHHGHAALIHHAATLARARGLTGGCVVSIYVNPTQFNDPSDFEKYPRTLDADLRLCEGAGAQLVWTPATAEIYPNARISGPEVRTLRLPDVASKPGLEDRFRPGHFAGVASVVRRLFELVAPVAAVFGEKDWQQLALVRALATDPGSTPDAAIEIVGHATIRDADGVAASSRNARLAPADRARAIAVPDALRAACAAATPTEAELAMRASLERAGLAVEYAVVRDAQTLMPVTDGQARSRPCRALVAAHLAGVRLIDNCSWPNGW